MTGLVYFIRCGKNGPIKIGFTRNIDRRLAQISVYAPEPPECIGFFNGKEEDEAQLHKNFSALRMNGEWFRPDPVLLEFVEQFSSYEKPTCKRGRKRQFISDEWQIIDEIAEDLGVGSEARRKWKSRGVAHKWRLEILTRAQKAGHRISVSDMEPEQETAA